MRKIPFPLACFSWLPTVLLAALLPAISHGQFPNPAQLEIQERRAIAAEDAARAARSAARRQASIEKRQWNTASKNYEKSVVPLSQEHLANWKKVKTARGSYWQYEIIRNKAIAAIVYYSPQIGYVVNDKWQKNGLGWRTMDEALVAHFGKDGVWTLPDIPGWAKSHLLSSEEQVADMKHRALEQAKPRAITKIADKVADGIVEQLGPKIGEDIGKDLGIKNPIKGKAGKKDESHLLFKRLDEDQGKTRYGDDGGTFMIYHYKDGRGFVLLHLDDKDDEWRKYDEVFTSMETAVDFATVKDIKRPVNGGK